MSPLARLFTVVLGATLAAGLSTATGSAAETEQREVFSPDGTITRVDVPVQREAPAPRSAVRADVVPIQQTGPSSERFDLVFVGDGYTSSQLGTYKEHVVNRWNELTQVEPFKSYKQRFNVWAVNVVSRQSGVDHDPRGTLRDTALDMTFWCGGTERLLCVNETKAFQYARLAPEVDQVVALANTTKYGGAGGRVATSSGGNAQAGQIVVHELGHSVGGLADEYDYPNDRYTGREPSEVNASKYTSAQMRQNKAKWYQYLGKQSPDGGVVGTYEGAVYHKRGVYRPTENSLMRSLGREFNLIGLDAMKAAIERKSRPATEGDSVHSHSGR
ncbi:M64 family metallopeptidase [Nocardia sp. CDC159]|uniref:M64 family metallopeptidase n=1 Tax=Nocardia pulmonis TaxID=2951408 RepID=A0A9X2E598_9NOCA|nr:MULTISPECIES: M64 family metallopeptidase [Nocardia]MCM6773915.1 M64 family metallopeptidase [Nocardia pulmonis]MCM6786802.1 M64 family metallopeptidase [Nocardia sp. CDC159]